MKKTINSTTKNPTIDNVAKYDAFQNAVTGFGDIYDNTSKISFSGSASLGQSELEDLYRHDWISRRIVEAIPDDALRQWVTFSDNKNIDELKNKIQDFDIKKKVRKALYLSRLYGGAVMILVTKNGLGLETPLRDTEDITCINILDRYQMQILSEYSDPFNVNFGEPEIYQLNASSRRSRLTNTKTINNLRKTIHESRLIRIDGNFLPDNCKNANDGWYDSVLNSINTALQQCGLSLQSGSQLVQDFVTKVLKIPNLVELIAADNYETIQARIQFALGNLSQAGIALVGADEEFDKIQTPITGLVDLINIFLDVVSGASGIPKSRLFSQTLGVLAGASETTRNYYDFINQYQQDELYPALSKIFKLLNNGNKVNFSFNPLWIPTQKESAEIHEIQMKADTGYINAQVITPEEVAISRFSDEGYNIETILDDKYRKMRKDFDDSRKKDNGNKTTPEIPEK